MAVDDLVKLFEGTLFVAYAYLILGHGFTARPASRRPASRPAGFQRLVEQDVTDAGSFAASSTLCTRDDDTETLLSKSKYPPSSRYPASSSSTLVPQPIHRHHTSKHPPIPARTVFARNAPRLHIPRLDNYVDSLDKPPWEYNADTPQMFHPLDRLAVVGKSLQDLETNSVVLSPLRDRKSIFGGLGNALLGLTVSERCFDVVDDVGLKCSGVILQSARTDEHGADICTASVYYW